MARTPLSAFPKQTSPAPRKDDGTAGKVVIGVIIVALIAGIFAFIHKRNSDQMAELARVEADNKRIQAENQAQAEERQRRIDRDKAERQARREAAARQAETAPAAEDSPQPDADPPEPEGGDDATAADDPATETADETGDETTDIPDADDEGSDESSGEGSGEGELVLTPEADKDPANAKRLQAMVRQAATTGEYEDFTALLRDKLTAAYPGNMKEDEGLLPTPIRKGKVGEDARCLYISLSLAMESAADADSKDQEAFIKWLLTGKQKPGIAFGKSLTRFKITEREDAAGMMSELRQAYKEDPKKAFSKIKAITNPLDHNVSKKLYPHSKKDIAATINRLKTAKQKGTLDIDQRDAVNLVNVYRYLCGLPTNVVYDATYEREATEAARACKAAGHIAHDLGHNTDKCNLFAGISGPPSQTVSGYMSDNGENNRKVRGHRAWILFPATAKTAFGKDGSYQAMRTMDSSGSYRPKTGWSYPGRGFFPLEYLHGTGWSYYMPPDAKKPESESDVKVEMWSVPKGLKSAPPASRLTKGTSIPILNTYVHLGAYMPTGNTIVFEPDYSKMKPQNGKPTGTYWLRVTWPGYKDEYVVEFY